MLLARADLDEEVLLKQNRPKTSALFTTVLHSEFYTVNILTRALKLENLFQANGAWDTGWHLWESAGMDDDLAEEVLCV